MDGKCENLLVSVLRPRNSFPTWLEKKKFNGRSREAKVEVAGEMEIEVLNVLLIELMYSKLVK